MGIEKSALKVTVAESFISDITKRRKKSEQNIYRFQGAAKALQEAEELLKMETQHTRDDFVAGKVELDLSDQLSVAKYVVSKLMRVSKKLHDISGAAFDSSVRAEGEVRGMELAISNIDNAVRNEKAKMMSIAEGIESGRLKVDEDQATSVESDSTRPAPRAVGTHPGLPMKAKRQKKETKDQRVRKAAGKKKAPKKKSANAKNS